LSKKKSLNVKNYKLGAKTMPTVESAVHLGIIRTTSLTENMTINVEENMLLFFNFSNVLILAVRK
jgi:hypothetical protein